MFKLSMRLSFLIVLITLTFNQGAFAEEKTEKKSPKESQYKKNEIRESRFGDEEKQTQIKQAYDLDGLINSEIFGQEEVAQVLRDKLVQYLEGFGQRTKEPVSLNLMGLPGIGKSAMIKVLEKTGIQVVTFDAQIYADKSIYSRGFDSDLLHAIEERDLSRPMIVVIDELDKVPEIDPTSAKEETRPLIGVLNKVLVDGMVKSQNISNVLIITTMNLAPGEISKFSLDALGVEKNFYDFTVADFQKFNDWVLSNPSAVPKLLSQLFRSNTVSRLAPVSVLVKPLDMDAYRSVAVKAVKTVIDRSSTGVNEGNRLEITYSEALIEFLDSTTRYAPSGARNTVTKVDILTEQLVNYAKRAYDKDPKTLLLPRKIHLDYDVETQSVRMTITPLKIMNNRDLVLTPSFDVQVKYSRQTGQFIQPKGLATHVPRLGPEPEEKEEVILKKDIRASRFPVNSHKAKGLSDYIDGFLFGQHKFSKHIESEMNAYMVRPKDATTAPHGVVFAGFPGIGKSEMIQLTGQYLDIPIVKVNLQQYTSDTPEAFYGLFGHIKQEVENLKRQGHEKYIILFEELDKIYEINVMGEPVDRPAMALVKDILNNGKAEMSVVSQEGSTTTEKMDLKGAFIAVTMNFAVDRFDFVADPRLTTIEDVQKAWQRLNTRLADLKSLLGTMFLPETVNRLISKIKILKPLGKADYQKVIELQIDLVIKDRFIDEKGRDIGQITVKTTADYRKYLYTESVVPSEGARFAANVSRSLINMDVEGLTKKIPRNSKASGMPLDFILDYQPGTKQVVGDIVAGSRKKDQFLGVYERNVELNFPPLNIAGKIPRDRLVTSIHEFGHALAVVRSGAPFESITVVPPTNGTGGYVKFRTASVFANDHISMIYATLASRAMERVMMSPNPLHENSVLDITSGASQDILQATKYLFRAVKQLGFDPTGGVMERMGVEGISQYANFSSLPHEMVEALGLVLKDVENTLVKDFLAAHTREWYAKKITTLARQGAMTERQYYELLEMKYPGESWERIETDSDIFKFFKKDVSASKFKATENNFQHYRNAFIESLQNRLGPFTQKKKQKESKASVLSQKRSAVKSCQQVWIH